MNMNRYIWKLMNGFSGIHTVLNQLAYARVQTLAQVVKTSNRLILGKELCRTLLHLHFRCSSLKRMILE
jgi:hypothetical protein